MLRRVTYFTGFWYGWSMGEAILTIWFREPKWLEVQAEAARALEY
jgi:hypothetical protein